MAKREKLIQHDAHVQLWRRWIFVNIYLIDWYRDQYANHVAAREAINNETKGFMLSYTDYAAPKSRFGHPVVSFIVTRRTFDALTFEHGEKVRHRGVPGSNFWVSFDVEKIMEIERRDREIAYILSEWKHQTWRYATWERTHAFKTRGDRDNEWIKL